MPLHSQSDLATSNEASPLLSLRMDWKGRECVHVAIARRPMLPNLLHYLVVFQLHWEIGRVGL